MTNIRGLKRICENGSGCAGCPVRRLCDAMNDLTEALEEVYDKSGSVPGDWSMHQTEQIHEAMTAVLYEMEPTPADVIRDHEALEKEEG